MEKAKTAFRSSMCAHRFLEIIYDEMLGRLAASTFIARDKTELAE